jgi:hypothetical protein
MARIDSLSYWYEKGEPQNKNDKNLYNFFLQRFKYSIFDNQ